MMVEMAMIFICRLVGHKFDWTGINRDGFYCPRCHKLVRSETGRDAKIIRKSKET